ncbi:MAG: DUF6615 family protein [Saprospiraceae bacterium]
MNQICFEFNKCSSQIREWLSEQPEVKEESLTDWYLYNLSKNIPIIKYKQFTRFEEGRKTGADWEWWFVFSDRESFAARIQAKKLKIKGDNYPALAYTSSDRLQMERLLDDGAKDGFASFYAFYSVGEKRDTMCVKKNLENEGVFLSEANKLRNEFLLKPRKQIDTTDILKLSNPVSCLFCCPQTYNSLSIKEGFRQYVSRYYPDFSIDWRGKNNNNQLGFKETPQYIRELIGEEPLPQYWIQERREFFRRTNAVVVVDLRNEATNYPYK